MWAPCRAACAPGVWTGLVPVWGALGGRSGTCILEIWDWDPWREKSATQECRFRPLGNWHKPEITGIGQDTRVQVGMYGVLVLQKIPNCIKVFFHLSINNPLVSIDQIFSAHIYTHPEFYRFSI